MGSSMPTDAGFGGARTRRSCTGRTATASGSSSASAPSSGPIPTLTYVSGLSIPIPDVLFGCE